MSNMWRKLKEKAAEAAQVVDLAIASDASDPARPMPHSQVLNDMSNIAEEINASKEKSSSRFTNLEK